MSQEIFDSAVRSAGDLAGVFEYDGDVAYFYLYDLTRDEGKKIVSAIQVSPFSLDIVEADIQICWDRSEERVGLFVRQNLTAVFDVVSKINYGGGAEPEVPLPSDAVSWFISSSNR